MENKIKGLHHITAIAGDAQKNYDFYKKLLGQRLVKKTVNFDDPGTYHFYYGDRSGTPGTILTFFPWKNVRKGLAGNGMATEIGYAVPEGSLPFWKERFSANNIKHSEEQELLGERFIAFEDPDGLRLKLIESSTDEREAWNSGTEDAIPPSAATKGFHSVVLTVSNKDATADVLSSVLGYEMKGQQGNRFRFITDAISTANIIDVDEYPSGHPGINAGGTNHHIAFRVKDDDVLMHYREKVLSKGLYITEIIDRNYFYSLYFREPGGVLFEIASDNPGFAIDEEVSELGKHLKLPSQYEHLRNKIEAGLPSLKQ